MFWQEEQKEDDIKSIIMLMVTISTISIFYLFNKFGLFALIYVENDDGPMDVNLEEGSRGWMRGWDEKASGSEKRWFYGREGGARGSLANINMTGCVRVAAAVRGATPSGSA
jgi:hypothetical protein